MPVLKRFSRFRSFSGRKRDRKLPIKSGTIRNILLPETFSILSPEFATDDLSDLIEKRPGTGICPSNINNVIGKKVIRYIPKDSLLSLKDLI